MHVFVVAYAALMFSMNAHVMMKFLVETKNPWAALGAGLNCLVSVFLVYYILRSGYL